MDRCMEWKYHLKGIIRVPERSTLIDLAQSAPNTGEAQARWLSTVPSLEMGPRYQDPPPCPCGEGWQNALHVLLHYPNLRELREKVL